MSGHARQAAPFAPAFVQVARLENMLTELFFPVRFDQVRFVSLGWIPILSSNCRQRFRLEASLAKSCNAVESKDIYSIVVDSTHTARSQKFETHFEFVISVLYDVAV